MQFNDWLSQVKESEQPILVKTIKNEQVRGKVQWFDNYNICIKNHSGETVFFKQNLVSVNPVKSGEK